MHARQAFLGVMGLAAAVLAGCGGTGPTAVVTGTVTYNGQPVKEGTITFTSKGGRGSVNGGTITDGKYTVREVPNGAATVFISAGGSEASTGPISSEESHAQSAKYKGKQLPGGAPNTAVPSNAVGNNAEIKVSGAEVKMDFDLKPPAK